MKKLWSESFLLFIIWLSGMLISGLSTASDHTFYLTNENPDFAVPASSVYIMQDVSDTLSIQSILNYNFKNTADQLNQSKRDVNVSYWLKLTLSDVSTENTNWILQLPLHSEYAEIYFLYPDQSIHNYSVGQALPFKNRNLQLRTLAFNFPPIKNEPVVIFIKLKCKKHLDISVIMSEASTYLEVHTKAYLFLGIIYGMLFLLVIYNLIIYARVREPIFLYYIFYIVCCIFLLSWKDGSGFQFLFPDLPSLNLYHHSIALLLVFNSLLFYSSVFLGLKNKFPVYYKLILTCIAVNTVYMAYRISDPAYFDPFPIIYLPGFLMILFLSVKSAFKGFYPAIFLCCCLTLILASLVTIKLCYEGIIGWTWLIEYILNYSVIADGILMSIANSEILSYLRKEKQRAEENKKAKERLEAENLIMQDKNRSLESEVYYKTNELATTANMLIRKAEFLSKLKNELERISKENDLSGISKLLKSIYKNSDLEDDWEQFQMNFDLLHNRFLSKLKEKYPHLKPGDLLLCAQIKMNKSNKEIAEVLNISVSGVEKKRSRLKEKLQLSADLQLTEYLVNEKF
ncbi:MAG: 7TM diverse intracellular signaling domain-containing protein [Cytophagaceae bacterium]